MNCTFVRDFSQYFDASAVGRVELIHAHINYRLFCRHSPVSCVVLLRLMTRNRALILRTLSDDTRKNERSSCIDLPCVFLILKSLGSRLSCIAKYIPVTFFMIWVLPVETDIPDYPRPDSCYWRHMRSTLVFSPKFVVMA